MLLQNHWKVRKYYATLLIILLTDTLFNIEEELRQHRTEQLKANIDEQENTIRLVLVRDILWLT